MEFRMDEPRKVTIELPAELDRRIDTLAGELRQPKSEVVEQALRNYLELQAWQVAAIKEGIAAADRGELVDQEEVMAWLDSWGTKREQPPPKPK